MLDNAHPSWRDYAITLYFRNHGKRCTACSYPVMYEDATLELIHGEIMLIHSSCQHESFPTDHLPEGSI